MRIVVLTAHSHDGEVQHRYVVARLLAEFGEDVAAIIVATGVHKPLGKRWKQWWRRYSARQITSRLIVRGVRRVDGSDTRREQVMRARLFPGGDDGHMPGGDRIVRVPSHNRAECVAMIERLKPDIVIVYGTLIIGRKTIAACDRSINLHTGLSPRYRGSDTMFWPLHNGEPEQVGVTVHQLVPEVDAGPLLARGRPAISAHDDADTIFAKGVMLGSELLCEVARRVVRGEARPLPQNLDEGREYRSVARTAAAERRTRKLLRGGLLKGGLDEWRELY